MRIQHTSGQTSYVRKEKNETERRETTTIGLLKSEHIADIFNNGQLDDHRTIKLRLSHGSRNLHEEFRQSIEKLLKEDKKLTAHIRSISLPAETEYDKDNSVRKVMLYIQWRTSEQRSDDPLFSSIQSCGKDEKILSLYNRNLEQREQLKQYREKNSPSYYYSCFPEAYSFN